MDSVIRKPNLGKRYRVGETFITTTKTMTKDRHMNSRLNKELTGPLMTYEVLRAGDERFFTKGKRRYWCKILALIELKTGYKCWTLGENSLSKTPRYWQFTYLVKVINN